MELVNQHHNSNKIKKNQKSSIQRIHAHELSIQDKDLVNCLYGDCYEDLEFKKIIYKQNKKIYTRAIYYFYSTCNRHLTASINKYTS